MLGLNALRDFNQQLRSLVRTSVDGTVKQFLVQSIPNFSYVEAAMNKFLARTQVTLLHDKSASNTVDSTEVSSILRTLGNDVIGSYNPFTIAWKFVLSLFGHKRSSRIATALNTLKGYSQLNDAPRFANSTLKKLISLMHKRINQIEGTLSKLDLSTNSRVLQDKTLQGLKDTFKSWVEVFLNILHGGVPGMGITMGDLEFLQSLESELSYGSHHKYLKDLAPSIAQAVQLAKQVINGGNTQRLNNTQGEARGRGRALAQSTA